MATVVLESFDKLFPRTDKTHAEVARDTMRTMMDQNPEYSPDPYTWNLNLEERSDGTAILHIKVIDTRKTTGQKWFETVFWFIVLFAAAWLLFT